MVLYLGVYFGGSRRDDVSGNWAARVDGVEIPTQQFISAARRTDEYYRQLFGSQYDQMRKQLQLGRQVIQGLVDQQIMVAEAKKLGLDATDDEVRRHILNDPNFQENGKFVGTERYVQAIERAFPGGVDGYERNLANELAVTKWRDLVTESASVTDEEIERTFRSRSDKTAASYVVVPSSKYGVNLVATDGEVRAWYDTHQQDYRRGEGRRIRFIVIDRQAQTAKIKITDQDVDAFYKENQANFTRPEQRRARHILFRVEPQAPAPARDEVRRQAEAALDRARKGEDFSALARTLSQDPGSAVNGGDLGFFGRGAMVPAFEKAAFETPVGQIAPLVESEFGFHVVQVTDSRPAGTAPLAEVRDSIKRQLELRRAQEMAQSEATRIRSEIKNAADLDTVAQREKIKVEETIVAQGDRTGDLGPSQEFLDEVFQLAPGSIGSPLGVAKGLAIAAVVGTVPPSIRPFEEVKDRARADLLNDRARRSAAAAARKAMEGGKDLAAIAKSLETDVRQSGDVNPGAGLPGTGRSPDLDRALFGPGATVGARGVVEVPAGAVVYEITGRESYDPAKLAASRAQIRQELLAQKRDTMLRSILEAMRSKHKIETNSRLVDSITG
jgi:peptidyl-prolyl cis-trans isomerase D